MNAFNYSNGVTRGRGRIELILGPMFSGKTTELIRRVKMFELAKFKCIVFKYAGDTRYSESDVVTHDLRTLPAVKCTNLLEYKSKAKEYEVIGIDEGQFFHDLVDFCEYLANGGKILLVAALDGTYRRSPFGDVLKLVPLAENMMKLNAVCMSCYHNASFTKRISDEKDVEIIGGADKYMAVCRECYHQNETVRNDANRESMKENVINGS